MFHRLKGIANVLDKCQTYSNKAARAVLVPLNDSLAAEFDGHYDTLTGLRDDIQKQLKDGSAPSVVQAKLDEAKSRLENFSKTSKGFDHLFRVFYPAQIQTA